MERTKGTQAQTKPEFEIEALEERIAPSAMMPPSGTGTEHGYSGPVPVEPSRRAVPHGRVRLAVHRILGWWLADIRGRAAVALNWSSEATSRFF